MVRPQVAYSDGFLRYDFGGGHALREVRVRLAHDLLCAYGLVSEGDRLAFVPATREDLLSAHTARYVDAVRGLPERPVREAAEFGLGPGDNPIFAGMYDAAALQVGATIGACEAVVSGATVRAYNLGGGFHHAMADRASGFCIFNDPAIGIRRLLDRHRVRRVLYLDIDAHHGDGVQAHFYRDPRVITISLHEDGRFLFPGTGFVSEIGEGEGRGFSVNVPLPPGTADAGYRAAFDAIVPPLARAFRPEVIVTQTGADAHAGDPLTHLALSTAAYEHVARTVDELSRELCGARWIAVGGGGYDVTACARVWTLIYAAMAKADLPDAVPSVWQKQCRDAGEPPPPSLRDSSPVPEPPHVEARVRAVIGEVRRTVFPFHGI